MELVLVELCGIDKEKERFALRVPSAPLRGGSGGRLAAIFLPLPPAGGKP